MNTAPPARVAPIGTLGHAARRTALVAFGLLAGAVTTVLLVDTALAAPATLYVEYKQATNGLLGPILPPLGGIGILATAVAVVTGRGRRRRALAVAALACGVAGMVLTVIVLFPMNAEIAAWSAEAPPRDWEQVRDRWAAAHVVRTLLTISGFVLLALDGTSGRQDSSRRPARSTGRARA